MMSLRLILGLTVTALTAGTAFAAGPPAGVPMGPPAFVTMGGPPAFVTQGPPAGVTMGPPAHVATRVPAGVPLGKPVDPGPGVGLTVRESARAGRMGPTNANVQALENANANAGLVPEEPTTTTTAVQ